MSPTGPGHAHGRNPREPDGRPLLRAAALLAIVAVSLWALGHLLPIVLLWDIRAPIGGL